MHTPGPWFTEALSTIGHCAIVDADGFTIANPSPMGMANARLIAAAPAMLEALSEMLGAAEMDCMDDKSNVWRSLMLHASSAIAAATKD
jgi:hypothetical protein